jgi:hypothetical protein
MSFDKEKDKANDDLKLERSVCVELSSESTDSSSVQQMHIVGPENIHTKTNQQDLHGQLQKEVLNQVVDFAQVDWLWKEKFGKENQEEEGGLQLEPF